MEGVTRTDVEFESAGTVCRAWSYTPASGEASICVVMAHGFGLTRSSGLEPFAQALAEDGYAVLLFDYRYFGDSDGEPRQLLSFGLQLEDWASAIAFARESLGVNSIVTWGTSLGAGHAISAAARDRRVVGTIALNPMVSGWSSTVAAVRCWGVANAARVGWKGLTDLLGSFVGGKPRYLQLTAPAGEVGLLTQPDAYPGYLGVVPEDFDFNMCARIALGFWIYRPGRHIAGFGRPLLSFVCTPDTINPAKPARRMLRRCPTARVVGIDCHHMEIYLEPHRNTVIQTTRKFLANSFG